MANGNIDLSRILQQQGSSGLQLSPARQSQIDLARGLASQSLSGQPVRGGPVEALSRVGQAFFARQMLDEAQQARDERQQRLAETLQGAVQAGKPQPSPIQEQGGVGSVGALAMTRDPQAQVPQTERTPQERRQAVLSQLLQNPDTAPAAGQIAIAQALQGPQSQKQTISGEQANQLLGTNFARGAGVTIERTPQGNAVVTGVQQPQERQGFDVSAQFGAIDTETGDRMTVLRTNRGLFRQRVDEQGRMRFEPVDSSRIRPVSTQEQGPSGQLAGLGGSEVEKLRDAEVATRSLVATAQDAIDLLRKNPNANTMTAGVARFANDLQQEATAFASNMGLDIEEGALDPSNYEGEFQELGIENAQMKSLLTSLAFQAAAASGQTGRSVSDRDVQRFIKEVGAQNADPMAFAQTLRDVANRAVRRFQTNYEVRTRGMDDAPPTPDIQVPEVPELDQESQIPSFSSEQEAMQAVEQGNISIGDRVRVNGQTFRVEE